MSAPLYFLGLRFWNDETDKLLSEIDSTGGMLAVPSAPSLAQAAEDELLQRAYQDSDWSVMDGGYVALILRAMGKSCRRISGLQLVQKITAMPGEGPLPMQDRRILWVVPTADEEKRIHAYLLTKQFDPAKQYYYRAPFYRSDEDFNDADLIKLRNEMDPDWMVLCLGGGRQEKLGYFLRTSNIERGVSDVEVGKEGIRNGRQNGPVILCTGAAIAFLSGGQANIPTWADRLYLGWFLRIAQDPRGFIPRYFRAAWHFPLALWRQRGKWFETPA